MSDLTDVIEDAISDSQLPAEPVDDATDVDVSADSSVDVSDSSDSFTEESTDSDVPELATAEGTTADEPEAEGELAPGKTPKTQDEFEKRFGIPQMSPTGRENRIPYSRVKKITEKAVSEIAEAALGRKLNPGEKAVDVVKQHVARIPELEGKVTDYEGRLERVGQFEHILENEPRKFLQMLSKVPAYAKFFAFVRESVAAQQEAARQSAGVAQDTAEEDDMPQPNEELADGSKIYNLDGLKQLLAWNSRKTEERVTRQLEQQYGPIRNEWQQQQHVKAVLPGIRAKIKEAKETWPHFTENEAEITQALKLDENLTLEGAYQKVVFPKLVADRDKMRQELIKEVKTAPRSTAVTGVKVAAKPAPKTGPRSIEDIIKEEVEKIR